MSRFILRPKNQTRQQTGQTARLTTQIRPSKQRLQTEVTAKTALVLRRPRSKAYMDMMHKLDSGGTQLDPRLAEEIAAIINKEFPRIKVPEILVGIVSRCYLGDPYEVHTLDMSGMIIKHYKRGESMPDGLERARHLALSGTYEFIEVYMDACRAVSNDGSVAVINI